MKLIRLVFISFIVILFLNACGSQDSYHLSFVDDDGTIIKSYTYQAGDNLFEVTFPDDPVKEGYTFNGWDSALETNIMPAYDIIIQAKYRINQYSVSFHSNGGTELPDMTADYMTVIEQPESPSRYGYVFAGWYTDEALTTAYDWGGDPLSKDIGLYAKWQSYGDLFNENPDNLYKFEAESSRLEGVPTNDQFLIQSQYASEKAVVGHLGQVGNELNFELSVSDNTYATLAFHMTAADIDHVLSSDLVVTTDTLEIKIDGVVMDFPDITLNGYGGASLALATWNNLYLDNVPLHQGDHIISLMIIDGDVAPYIDYLEVYSTDAQISWETNPYYLGNVSYDAVIKNFEWGVSVTQLILNFKDDLIYSGNFTNDTFAVYAEDDMRHIENVYLSDAFGKPVDTDSSHYVTLDLQVGYDVQPIDNSTALAYDYTTGLNVMRDLSIYTVRLGSRFIVINELPYTCLYVLSSDDQKTLSPDTEGLLKDTYTYEDMTLHYAAYETYDMLNDGVSNPLIIWLHGGGEGGSDVDVALLGTETTALFRDPIQSYFKYGAYVLVPQSPTLWMDQGDGQLTSGETPSIYTTPLMALIEEYVTNHPDVDPNKIYLVGASNGGYMTMALLLNNPDYFAAAILISEAFEGQYLTDAMALEIADIPMWFVASTNDYFVSVTDYTQAVYDQLVLQGAKNIHLSLYDEINGLDAPGVTYLPHWAWIKVFNDDVTSHDINLWDWLSLQVKP